jgi:hypothetical protein
LVLDDGKTEMSGFLGPDSPWPWKPDDGKVVAAHSSTDTGAGQNAKLSEGWADRWMNPAADVPSAVLGLVVEDGRRGREGRGVLPSNISGIRLSL